MWAAASGNLPRDFGNVSNGDVIPGYVSRVTNFGVFVNFLSSLSGLAMRGNVADEFVTDPSKHFQPGQSVRARVLHLDPDTQKMQLSLKQSDCQSGDISFLRSYFTDVWAAAGSLGGVVETRGGMYASIVIGGIADGVVEDSKYGGIVVDLGDDLTGFVKTEHCQDIECEVGQTVRARVLDVDPRKAIVDLSLLPSLVVPSKKTLPLQKPSSEMTSKTPLLNSKHIQTLR